MGSNKLRLSTDFYEYKVAISIVSNSTEPLSQFPDVLEATAIDADYLRVILEDENNVRGLSSLSYRFLISDVGPSLVMTQFAVNTTMLNVAVTQETGAADIISTARC